MDSIRCEQRDWTSVHEMGIETHVLAFFFLRRNLFMTMYRPSCWNLCNAHPIVLEVSRIPARPPTVRDTI